jgi:hypothetical protein
VSSSYEPLPSRSHWYLVIESVGSLAFEALPSKVTTSPMFALGGLISNKAVGAVLLTVTVCVAAAERGTASSSVAVTVIVF